CSRPTGAIGPRRAQSNLAERPPGALVLGRSAGRPSLPRSHPSPTVAPRLFEGEGRVFYLTETFSRGEDASPVSAESVPELRKTAPAPKTLWSLAGRWGFSTRPTSRLAN